MAAHALAGRPAPAENLIDIQALEQAYYNLRPDPDNPAEQVSFGTSGHRGSSIDAAFNETHILAITQAICEYRQAHGIDGPLMLGQDSHALSAPAARTALEVLAANDVPALIQAGGQVTPTPAISRAILAYNREHHACPADGIVITPSHNPPEDGGFKYNPPHGGPADTDVTAWIQNRANALIRANNHGVRRVAYETALQSSGTIQHDFITPYVDDLATVIDFDVFRNAMLKIAVDPLGGASAPYWEPIAEKYGLNIEVINPRLDPTFGFMTLDHDGKIRMDCSSPYAMAGLVKLRDQYDIAWGNDPDADRHGIVTRSIGLMNPNHFLAVAIRYLVKYRPRWKQNCAIGKTLVSSSLIDRVAASFDRPLLEVPVGFKWFVPGLLDGSVCFAGEESAGASFLRRDGTVWTTDKDGLILGLLAAEITARTGRDPGAHYQELSAQFGAPHYKRIDAPATPAQKDKLKKLSPDDVTATELAGEPIQSRLTTAPGNNAPIGGLKVTTENGWFAARPSGTEDVYKLYAESFVSELHLAQIIAQAQEIVKKTLG
ncbi:MAG: phosphoglucomutase (alpha-D-glucose-1,6-bisphosphate-dependent) [Blastocatellia bacterium]